MGRETVTWLGRETVFVSGNPHDEPGYGSGIAGTVADVSGNRSHVQIGVDDHEVYVVKAALGRYCDGRCEAAIAMAATAIAVATAAVLDDGHLVALGVASEGVWVQPGSWAGGTAPAATATRKQRCGASVRV